MTPNFNAPIWSSDEKITVDESWDINQAWSDYRLIFPHSSRSREAIRRRWNRAHPINHPDVIGGLHHDE